MRNKFIWLQISSLIIVIISMIINISITLLVLGFLMILGSIVGIFLKRPFVVYNSGFINFYKKSIVYGHIINGIFAGIGLLAIILNLMWLL